MVSLTRGAGREAAAAEFSKRLQFKMNEAGMRQSDLMRAAQPFLPPGKKFNRDHISHYIRGKHIPLPLYLEAIAKALGCKASDLLPGMGLSNVEKASPFKMTEQEDGNVWVSINSAFPWEVALKIMALAKSAP